MMPGRSTITADEEGRTALRALARSARRGEADRARAILLTLAGQRAATIAAGLGVHVSTVREWRGLFRHGGVAALRHRPAARTGSARRPWPWRRQSWPRMSIMTAAGPCHGCGPRLSAVAGRRERRGGPAIGEAWLSVQLRRKTIAGAGHATR
jgi:transposase-like protein